MMSGGNMRIKELPAKPKEQKKLRVAAYARVSAEMEWKLHSLEEQEDYYRGYITNHSGWELVEVYSDYGISGTTIQRPEFQRMLEDCRAGKIDLVVTKSVTRFARNTVILLQTIRELKSLGIDCFFEKEQMHSISPDGELLLTLLAMYAEEEARSASENQLWRIHKRFEQGRPWVGNMLGYRLVEGKMIIVPEEAEIVRQIYADYLSGMGKNAIANKLLRSGVQTQYSKNWTEYYIGQILQNEKYIGDMLLQKTYRQDFRSKKGKVNHGAVLQYYIEGSHEAIIDKETFDAVQRERARRNAHGLPSKKESNEENIFVGMIICGKCEHHYIRKHFSGKYGKTEWICNRYLRRGKSACPSQKIQEHILLEKTKEVLETDNLSRKVLDEKLMRIIVPDHNHLIYMLKDGRSVDVFWEHPSRRLSWTPEMKEAARQRALDQRKKD